MKKRVLILCTGNSCRSQMAEGIWNELAGATWRADSAGSDPSGSVHPLAIEAMREIDIDISHNRSKHVDEFIDTPIDLCVTACDNAQRSCPALPNAKRTLHWPFDDPADATGTNEERLAEFRRVRDEIRAAIATFLRDEPRADGT